MFTMVFGRQHHDSGVTNVHFIYSHDSAVLIQHNPAAAFQIHHNQTCLWAGVHEEYSQQEPWWLWSSGKTNLCLFIHNLRFGCPFINKGNLLAFADLWPRKDIYSELNTGQGTLRGKKEGTRSRHSEKRGEDRGTEYNPSVFTCGLFVKPAGNLMANYCSLLTTQKTFS